MRNKAIYLLSYIKVFIIVCGIYTIIKVLRTNFLNKKILTIYIASVIIYMVGNINT